jgi:hypothetical protein
MKKSTIKIISLAVLELLLWYSAALAAGSATVSATVTVQNVSLSVTSGTISYGIIPSNTSKSTIATDLNDTQTVTNNGNVAEDVTIKGQNSTNWTLASSNGTDQYVQRYCTSTCATPPTGYTALTTSYQDLKTNLASLGTQNFDLQITTPNPSTVFTQQNVDVSILAAAH